MKNSTLFLVSVAVLAFVGCSEPRSAKPDLSFKNFVAVDKAVVGDPVPTTECDATCQTRRQEFRYVVYVGKQIYCYWDLKKADTGVDFDVLAGMLENSIKTAMSETNYYLTLRKWASAFHDGHVNVLTKTDVSMLEIYTAPIRVEVLAPATDHEKLIVSAVGAGSGGLSVGDEITMVNNLSAKDAITAAAAESSSGSTERMRRFWAARRIVDVMGVENASAPFVITAKTLAKGETKIVALPRAFTISPKPVDGPAGVPDQGGGQVAAQILPNGVGYLKLDGFGGAQDDFLIGAAVDSLAGTRGMIIDLRKNGGGDLSGDRVIERLIDKAVVRYKRSERLSDYTLAIEPEFFTLTPDATGAFAQWHDLPVTPLAGHHYGKPVVAITSPWCFSACDTFSAALRGNNLAMFVGEATGGGTGTPLVFDLPASPFQFRYGVIRGQTPTGTFIEGNGTLPDTILEPTALDRATGTDSQLMNTISILEGKISLLTKAAPVTVSPSILNGIVPSDDQSLDRSPTDQENALLRKISANDEK
jgi:C-terminal processing protease CtpA/Prc